MLRLDRNPGNLWIDWPVVVDAANSSSISFAADFFLFVQLIGALDAHRANIAIAANCAGICNDFSRTTTHLAIRREEGEDARLVCRIPKVSWNCRALVVLAWMSCAGSQHRSACWLWSARRLAYDPCDVLHSMGVFSHGSLELQASRCQQHRGSGRPSAPPALKTCPVRV